MPFDDAPADRDDPAGRAAPRIAPLAALPLFHKLAGRRVVLAGGSEGVAWKAEVLAATGAQVDLYAAAPCATLADLARDHAGPGRIVLHRRPWSCDVFAGAALAVGDVEGDGEAEAFRCAARLAGVTVNIVDKPSFCDVQFGSIVNRSPLVVGISTDGAAPVFGQAIRARIESLLPAGFRRWAEAARAWRPDVQALDLPFRARRRLWETFTARALAHPDVAPTEQDRRALLAPDAAAPATGRVVFVGAGPGDPELLTLKAMRVLQSADVILHDDLVGPGVLDLARREARRVAVGKRGGRESVAQADIVAALLAEAGAGRVVVRLKGGDPAVFGRLADEIDACRAAGIPVAVVPGVTAASGAAASLGLSLTHARSAPRLQFVTAHGPDGRLPEDVDWRALADPRATTAVYMGLRTAGVLSARLRAEGLGDDTPVLLVQAATLPEERHLRTTLADLAAVAAQLPDAGPTLLLIGDIAG